jgi:hypothetical protein
LYFNAILRSIQKIPASFRKKTAPVDRLGAKFVDVRVSLASAWKMQTTPLGVAVGSTKFKSDTDMKQAAYHPKSKFLMHIRKELLGRLLQCLLYSG